MKNKDKYDLRNINASANYMINGCGKKIKESCEITIKYNDKVIKRIKSQEYIVKVVLDWLEEESL